VVGSSCQNAKKLLSMVMSYKVPTGLAISGGGNEGQQTPASRIAPDFTLYQSGDHWELLNCHHRHPSSLTNTLSPSCHGYHTISLMVHSFSLISLCCTMLYCVIFSGLVNFGTATLQPVRWATECTDTWRLNTTLVYNNHCFDSCNSQNFHLLCVCY
jgi:hypothetical protein